MTTQEREYIQQASFAEPTEEDKAWTILLAYALATGQVLKALNSMSVMRNNLRQEKELGKKSTVQKLLASIERNGIGFVNALREFQAFYLKGNHNDRHVAEPMLELTLKALHLPLTAGVERMAELDGYLDNFDQGQYRDIDVSLFEAIEDMPTDPSAAVQKLIDTHCPRTSKINREKLALAFEQLVHIRSNAIQTL